MARVTIELPGFLAERAGGENAVVIRGDTVAEVLWALGRRHPALGALLWPAGGAFNPALAVFVNRDNIAQRDGLDTALSDGDSVTVISALEGG